MVRQFLLNPDGSVPAGTRVDLLLQAGIPLVLPTPRWRTAQGMMLEEADPQQDADGIWRQVWVEVPVPPPEPPTDEAV